MRTVTVVLAVIVALLLGGVAGSTLTHSQTKTVTKAPQACLNALRSYDRYSQLFTLRFQHLRIQLNADLNGSDPTENDVAQMRHEIAFDTNLTNELPSSDDITTCLRYGQAKAK